MLPAKTLESGLAERTKRELAVRVSPRSGGSTLFVELEVFRNFSAVLR